MSDVTGRVPAAVIERAAAVAVAVFDVDGVLTDGRIVLGDDGHEYKAFHTHDGHGLRMLGDSGVEIAIITGRSSTVVSRRAEELGIRHVMQGRSDKAGALSVLVERLGMDAGRAAYVGDDVVDVAAMHRAGLAVAVADATPVTRAHADYVTQAPGGRGAAREVCELIMAAHGTLEPLLGRYLLD